MVVRVRMKVQPNVKTAKLRNVQCLLFVVGQILEVVVAWIVVQVKRLRKARLQTLHKMEIRMRM